MCVQYVAKHSLHPAVLASTEIFIEDNNQTLRQPRIRDVVILENGCVSYIYVDYISFPYIQYKYNPIYLGMTLPLYMIASTPLYFILLYSVFFSEGYKYGRII